MTTELLNVRLNSVNDILALQEDEMMEKVSEGERNLNLPTQRGFGFMETNSCLISSDIVLRWVVVCVCPQAGSETLLKGSSKGGRVLRCWREKVFTLLVQLRAKDLETRGEREKLHLAVCRCR